ncbi:ankyrin repeat-containing domain protein [Dactylonectria macrodidyma]|uniref:Ankyrin repeat-containing domain protein n=1 Tax=Dactylonectria macrodidyma TaxID=307937 RepID=A0A9P9F6N3_9HYPO|nr:ankyrin repeat-containing domain protein [Dactylonectria macrodidyma]
MSINWKLYKQDINRLYLDEDKTVKETVQFLKETHHVVVTERQFKTKFGGLKNLRANEWKAVIPHIRRREARGIASLVYLSGKRLKLDSTTRAIRRYSKGCQGETTHDTEIDLGIDTVGLHRIEIRTPVTSSAASALIRNPNASSVSSGSVDVQQSSDDVVRMESSLADQVIELDDIDIVFDTQIDTVFSVESVLNLSDLPTPSQLSLGSVTAIENGPNPFPQFLDLESWSRNGPKRPFQSFWDLPEMPSLTSLASLTRENNSLRTLLDNYSEAQGIRTHIPQHLPRPMPVNRKRQGGWVLSKLVDANSRLAALETMAELVDDLIQSQAQTPWGPPGSASAYDDAISAASVHLHYKLFPVVTFIISNNHFDDGEIMSFLRWVIQNGLMTQLLRLLETTPTDALAFRSALLKAICTFRSHPGYSKEFVHSSEFLSLVSSHCHYLQGPLGARLLFLSIEEDCLELARLLVSHGLDINHGFPHNSIPQTKVTPVAFAAGKGSEAMICYLISAGADINNRFHFMEDETTALHEAIKSRRSSNVKILLKKGARFNVDETVCGENILQFAWKHDLTIYSMLRERVPLINQPDVFELIDAAEMGNQEVSSLLLKHSIVHTEIMERALCGAIKAGMVNAVGTLLRRGVDPNTRLAQLLADSTTESDDDEIKVISPIHLLPTYDNIDKTPDLVYLLVKAGAEVDKETSQALYQRAADYLSEDWLGPRILSVLLQSDSNAAWVRSTLLVCWARMGYISSCGELLDTGTAINGYGLGGESALQMASGHGHVALVHYLLSRGADVNLAPSDSENGASALYAALEGGHPKLANYLVDAGANVTAGIGRADGATILEGMTPPVREALGDKEWHYKDYNRTFKKLLALGAPVNRTNNTASTILHNLVESKQHECLELALRAGARTEDTRKGLTPLQAAALRGDMNSLRILIAHGANVNVSEDQESYQRDSQASLTFIFPKYFSDLYGHIGKDQEYRCTALQAATISRYAHLQLIHFLLENGANVNAPAIAQFGRTALQAVTSSTEPNMEVIRLLLLHGADVNAPPAKKGGVTALQGAAIQGHMEIARLLLAHGALINALPAVEDGRTAMEGAAEHGRMEMVRFLFSEGALPDPFLGFSRAIELAEKECHLGIVKFLKEHDPCNLLITGSPILSQSFS